MSLLAALNPLGARRLRVDGKSYLSAEEDPAKPPIRLASAWSRVMRGQHPHPAVWHQNADPTRSNSF